MVRAVNDGGEAQSIADIAVFEPTPDTMVEVVKTVVFEDVRKHETLVSYALFTINVSCLLFLIFISYIFRHQQLAKQAKHLFRHRSQFIPNLLKFLSQKLLTL